MRIEVKGRNITVDEDLREHVEKRFRTIAAQVSELAVSRSRSSRSATRRSRERQVAEATLYLKGVTCAPGTASSDLEHSIDLISEELARQVKRHREKRAQAPRGT